MRTLTLAALALLVACDVPEDVATNTDAPIADAPELADDSNPPSEGEATLLARVALESGHTVEFFGFEPGELLISQAGPGGEAPPVDSWTAANVPADEIFAILAPGEPVPAALVEAAEHREALLAEAGIGEIEVPEIVASATSSAGWFQTNHCPTGSADVMWCWLDRTSWTKKQVDDAFIYETKAYAHSGTVRLDVKKRHWASWDTVASLDVLPGTYRAATWTSGAVDPDVLSTVSDIHTGDIFHHSGWANQ